MTSEVQQLLRRVDALEHQLDLISQEYVDSDTLLDVLAEHLPNLDVDVLHDGERSICFRIKHGDEFKHYPIHLPVPLDRGVYQAGQSYVKGDVISFGGQIWIAQHDTSERPGGNDQWRLAVRHGRDLRSKKKTDDE